MNCLQLYDDRMVNINTNKLVKSHYSCKYTTITFYLFIYIIFEIIRMHPSTFFSFVTDSDTSAWDVCTITLYTKYRSDSSTFFFLN